MLQDRYHLGAELGRGGFGAVYKAWDNHLNRPCAIKENLEASFDAQRQFIREASVLADLHHPNLPRVTDYFLIPNAGQYLVMDFVEGEDLHHLVEKRGRLPIEQAVAWIIQVTQALEYLHEHQPPILHRDIKPANIRITPKGKALLVDFGLVKLYDPNLRTTMGARAVTPGYAPPEQYGRGMTDARTDVYAIAATLYYALTAEDPLESVQRVSGEHNPRADELNHRVPASLALIIEKGLALLPDERYQSAAEFRMALVNCLRATPASAGFVDSIVQVQGPVIVETPRVDASTYGTAGPIPSTVAMPPPIPPQEPPIDRPQPRPAVQQPPEPELVPLQPAAPKPSGSRPELPPVQPGSPEPKPSEPKPVIQQPLPPKPPGPRPEQAPVQPKPSAPRPGAQPAKPGPSGSRSESQLGSSIISTPPSEPVSRPRPGTIQAPSGRKLSWGLVAGAAIAGLAVIAVLFFVFDPLQMNVDPTATVFAQQTMAVQVQATGTRQAAMIATIQAGGDPSAGGSNIATLQPLTPGLPAWPVIIRDEFDDNQNNWWVGTKTDTEFFSRLQAELVDGVHLIRLEPKSANVLHTDVNQNFPSSEQFVLAADTRQVDGPSDTWHGVIFRYIDQTHYYVFAIQDAGKAGVWQYKEGNWLEILSPKSVKAIMKGNYNKIIVYGQGNIFTFYINNEIVTKLTLDGNPSGLCGLYYEAVTQDLSEIKTDHIMLAAP